MKKQDRRTFLQTSAVALAAGLNPMRAAASDGVRSNDMPSILQPMGAPENVPTNEGKKPLRLGLILGIGKDPDAAIAKVHDLGLPTCQVFVTEIESELVPRLRAALDKYKVEATSLVVGGPGKEVWDFYGGQIGRASCRERVWMAR